MLNAMKIYVNFFVFDSIWKQLKTTASVADLSWTIKRYSSGFKGRKHCFSIQWFPEAWNCLL